MVIWVTRFRYILYCFHFLHPEQYTVDDVVCVVLVFGACMSVAYFAVDSVKVALAIKVR